MIQWIGHEGCEVALDTRYDPALISTWYGQASCELIDRYFRWSDTNAAAALAAEQQLVHIVDLRFTTLPAPAACKRLIEHARDDLGAEVTLSSVVVLGDPALRWVVSAAHRMSNGRGLEVVNSIDAAIELALRRMWDARIPPPCGLAPGRYEAPTLELTG
ncbi:hypothetical protein ENSA5_20460 [Enhygromyxa salina]|uniref:Uncharacterized protein n=1 Tax=Enhygromyxa salina TaxID=215803 RepID=A0A2S9YCN8_9BACT|nr:hypothetical protein [Enhygromyxa salina]PRQ02869.1 hypothetical protein ENSA5_20460 [Enhygromyxa salina]